MARVNADVFFSMTPSALPSLSRNGEGGKLLGCGINRKQLLRPYVKSARQTPDNLPRVIHHEIVLVAADR
ncbi:MAG: hypothetical protein H6R26_1666, partial [Proteobacteria bacterium]|nr:hypothetical protein [Pseudomonadota bacterium]